MMDALGIFWTEMLTSKDYIKIDELKDLYVYEIWARNAYIGIWVEKNNGFMISRYKVGQQPYLFCEYHWDFDEVFGTVKPIREIAKSPFDNVLDTDNKLDILAYLDELEEKASIISGVNTLQKRKASAKRFSDRLAGRGEFASRRNHKPVYEIMKELALKEFVDIGIL